MDFDDLHDRLPLASLPFTAIREWGKRYVDKTAFVYRLAQEPRPVIFTRPRRWGKSTLAYTLEELFLHGVAPYDGHESYFKGLAIEELWQDEGQYLVLRLDLQKLSAQCDTAAKFELKLSDAISDFCRAHELTVSEGDCDFGTMFQALLTQLPERSFVLLVDEYDTPLTHFRNNETELRACKALMHAWFRAIAQARAKLRCVFFTGITRCPDLLDPSFLELTFDPSMAQSCGFTRAELKQSFADNLRYAAAVHADCAPETVSPAQIETLLDEMAEWFDGFCFAGTPEPVFSTWSVINFFADQSATLDGYWSSAESGGAIDFLVAALTRLDPKQLLAQLKAQDFVLDAEHLLQTSFINPDSHPYGLLQQMGYLTLRQPVTAGAELHLTWPNHEIGMALAELVAQCLQVQQCKPLFLKRAAATLQRLNPYIRMERSYYQ